MGIIKPFHIFKRHIFETHKHNLSWKPTPGAVTYGIERQKEWLVARGDSLGFVMVECSPPKNENTIFWLVISPVFQGYICGLILEIPSIAENAASLLD